RRESGSDNCRRPGLTRDHGRSLFGAAGPEVGFRSAGGAGRTEPGAGGLRTITSSSMSERSSLPTTRFVDRSVSESLLTGSMASVEDVVRPSPVIPFSLMIQVLPERVHCP